MICRCSNYLQNYNTKNRATCPIAKVMSIYIGKLSDFFNAEALRKRGGKRRELIVAWIIPQQLDVLESLFFFTTESQRHRGG